MKDNTFLLPFVLICSQKMYGQASFFDAHVSKYGELEQVLGDKWDKIDSLIVHGPINKADFKTIVSLCERWLYADCQFAICTD